MQVEEPTVQLLQATQPAWPGKTFQGSKEARLPQFINPSEQSSRKKNKSPLAPQLALHTRRHPFNPACPQDISVTSFHFQWSFNTAYEARGEFSLLSICMGEIEESKAYKGTTKTSTKSAQARQSSAETTLGSSAPLPCLINHCSQDQLVHTVEQRTMV